MKAFALINNDFQHLGFCVPLMSVFCWSCMDSSSCFFLGVWYARSWTSLDMRVMKASHSGTSCFNNSKWKFLVRQSTCGLCKASQDNLMMTRFFKEEMTLKMTLKMTLLIWKPMATFNALVSCVTSFHERFWPSMTSIGTSVFSLPRPTCIITPFFC